MVKMKVDSSSTVGDDDCVSMDGDLFSDESSFHGDDEMKASFEKRAACYDPTESWNNHSKTVQYIAATNQLESDQVEPESSDSKSKKERLKTLTPRKKQEHADPMDLEPKPLTPLPTLPYNPYEGEEMAKQLDEPLSTFLNRLKPSTATTESGPWIWIANPDSTYRATHPDIAGFKDAGYALLEEYRRRKCKLEEKNPTKTPGVITRMLKADRLWLEDAINSLAKAKQLTSGKWMLFSFQDQVDKVWTKIAEGTLNGRLGFVAKVATGGLSGKSDRVICVYTEDYSNKDDVARVLREMRRLKLLGDKDDARAIYYKCDAYTYLDIMKGNDYKLRASMYNSKEIFEEMGGD